MTLKLRSSVNPDLFTISYIGTLSDTYPVAGLLDAVENLIRKDYDIKLRFVGAVSSSQRKLISLKPVNC